MNQEDVAFENDDGQELAGVLHRPDGAPAAWVVFAHCFTCTKNVKAAVHVSQALVDNGFAVLRFDFTGLGESEGEFCSTTISTNVGDLVAAAAYLEREHAAPAVLVGHSFGGAAVLRAAHRLPSVRAVATIAAPADPGHVRHLLGDAEKRIREQGEADVMLAGRPFRIGRAFLEELERDDWKDVINDLRRPLLVFHSPVDDTVPIDNARQIFDNALHPKSFVSLEDADHLLSDAADSRYVAAVLAAWVSRYLGAGGGAELAEDDAVEGVVATIGRQKFRTELRTGKHVFIADEPVASGGGNLGPSPYDFIAASLAGCTAMTLRIYADREKLGLAQASVRVRHDRIHVKDCEECATDGGRIDRLRREVSLEGDLSAEDRERLLAIADRCPVHKTLAGEIRIETHMSESKRSKPER